MARHAPDVRPFHLAVPVADLEEARAFYSMLGARPAVEQDHCIIWDFFGHQVVTHHVHGYEATADHNLVDQHNVPVPHFGIVLEPGQWEALRAKLDGKVDFVIKPHQRYVGTSGEQSTMFLRDPFGNALEFKAFQDDRRMFER